MSEIMKPPRTRVVARRPDTTQHDNAATRLRQEKQASDDAWEAERAGRELDRAREERGPLRWWPLKSGLLVAWAVFVMWCIVQRCEEDAAYRASRIEAHRKSVESKTTRRQQARREAARLAVIEALLFDDWFTRCDARIAECREYDLETPEARAACVATDCWNGE